MQDNKPLSKEEICKHAGNGIFVNTFTGNEMMFVEDVDEAMDEYAKQEAIRFIEYNEVFRREEGRWFRKECKRLGGMFSLADYGIENIYNDFVNKKPIKSVVPEDVPNTTAQWEYDENGKLTHVITKTS